MGSRYRHVSRFAVFTSVFIAILFSYNNCANKAGNLTIKDLSSSPPDTYLANEFGGSGAMINSSQTNQVILFQDASNTNLMNRDGGVVVKQNGIRNGYGMGAYIDPNDFFKTKFFVIDRDNNRILIFNQVPRLSTALPDVVVGQLNFADSLPNAGRVLVNGLTSVNETGFNRPVAVSVCGDGKMLVTDAANHRVLVYNKIPTVSGVAADLVVGQPNFTTNLPLAGAAGLNTPYAAYCFDRKLFVLDRNNSRIVVHNVFPTVNNAAADFAIGQPDFTTVTAGCAPDKFSNAAYEIARYKNELYVVDGNNHRVLRFSTIPTAFGASAANVIGQPNLTTCLPNQGSVLIPPALVSPAAANTIHTVNSLAVGKDTLVVTDWGNSRILFYTLPILADNVAAKGVLGQPNLITNPVVTPVTASSVNRSKGMVFDGNYLWMNSGGDNRTINMLLPIVP